MAKLLVTDELWAAVEPLLPLHPPQPKGGRPWVDDRAALTGIVFVLLTGIPWEYLPAEMNCGSGHDLLATPAGLAGGWRVGGAARGDARQLEAAKKIDWSRASCDSATVPAPLTKKGAVKPLGRIRPIVASRARSATRL